MPKLYRKKSQGNCDRYRIERMSLHPILDDCREGTGPAFQHRVAWRRLINGRNTWGPSCRGPGVHYVDCYTPCRNCNTISDLAPSSCTDEASFDLWNTLEDAVDWLLEAEVTIGPVVPAWIFLASMEDEE